MRATFVLAGSLPLLAAAAGLLPSGDFEWAAKGEKAGWRTSSQVGGLLAPGEGLNGSAAIGVEDAGTNNCKWLSPPVMLEPSRVYGFSAQVKISGGGGLTIGTPTVNVTDHGGDTGGKWEERRTVVFSSDYSKVYPETFRLGEYHVNGKVLFDGARVVPLKVVYAQKDGLELGHGERMAGNRYVFNSQWVNIARIHARPLHALKGLMFNTDHCDAGGGSYIVYRHGLAGRSFRSAAVTFSAASVKNGAVIEASADGERWTRVAAPTNFPTEGLRVEIPAALLPAAQLFVRLTVAPKGWMRLLGYSFAGEVDGASVYLAGSSRYVDAVNGEEFTHVDAPCFYTTGYGARLDVKDVPFAAWTALAGWKVPKAHPLPEAQTKAVRVAAAANEAEAVQLVLRPTEDLAGAQVSCDGDLRLGAWFGFKTMATIPASAVEVFRVGYVPIVRVKDRVGCADDWPDTLLPQEAKPTAFTPAELKKGESAPYWVRVKVPKGTPPGVYRGELKVACRRQVGGGASCRVPFEVEVYGFTLPDRMTIRTGFGLGTSYIDRYHRLKKLEDKRRVYGMYFESLSAHHVSPYDYTPGVKWKTVWRNGEPVIDWTDWDAAMEDARRRYGFTDFRLPGPLGLGGGNEAESFPGIVPGLGIKSDNPDYEKYEAKYLKAIEAHLKAKGWLKDAYVYCYDEPRRGADKLVKAGLSLVAKHAPGLDRLLTAPVRDSLVGGPNIWCPIARDLHLPGSAERRAAGDRFWWYVCMFPKPPYPSLFIDHPGVDLRVWLWQSWREEMEGILIWNTTWWTSNLAYPDPKRPQNPYLDATAWSPRYPGVGASNGDGRFFYPPADACAAFDEGREIGPVLERPVETIRLEYIRDGIEDFEYFVMLKKLDPTNPLLKVPPEVSASPTEFAIDPVHMERHREKLARAIASRVGSSSTKQ